MFGVNDLEITMYFVGADKEAAQLGLPFDSYESAESYAKDNPGMKIFNAHGMVDLTTLEEV